MTREEAVKLKAKCGTTRAAAKSAHMRVATFRAILNGNALYADKPAARQHTAAVAEKARTLADFRKEHDQAWKIRDGLKRLFGGQVIMTDSEFRDAVSGNPSRWRAAADMTEFKENRYRVSGELYWAAKETIREMRKIKGEAI